jgi:hypothetical protein
VLNDLEEMSVSSAQDGALSKIPTDQSANPAPFASFHFDSGPVVVTAAKSQEGAMAFILYRAPSDFSRGSVDDDKASRSISFRVQSLDLPCFMFIWPSTR